MRSTVAVLVKEARVEGRSRLALGATVLFSVCALTAVAYTIGETHIDASVQAALLWVVLLFAAMSGLARPFVREEEMQTADYLRLYVRPSSVLTGKLLFNAGVMLAIEIVTAPLFFIVIPTGMVKPDAGLLTAVLALGGLGLASTSTFVAAMIAQASAAGSRGALFFVIAFPALAPLLMASSHATFAAMAPVLAPPDYASNALVVIGSYDAIVIAAGYLLFASVWSDS